MVIIKPEWVGFEIQLSHSYPDGSQWGMHYDSYEVDHVDTGHSDKVVKIECDGLETTLSTKLSEVEAERDKYRTALMDLVHPAGVFKIDPLEHAKSVIEETSRIATEALEASHG